TSSVLRSGFVPWKSGNTPARNSQVPRDARIASGTRAAGALEVRLHALDFRREVRVRGRGCGPSSDVPKPRVVHVGQPGSEIRARHLVVGEQSGAQAVRLDGSPHRVGGGNRFCFDSSWGGRDVVRFGSV